MKIFVGCSSSNNIPDMYLESAKEFLSELFKRNHSLIFGANNNVIMGIAYDCALENEREIIGICPQLYKHDFEKLNCSKEIVTKTVGERTENLMQEADVLLFLPGGIGTVYELFTAIESKRSHEFDKPIIVYNCNNYFDKLFEFLNKVYGESFTAEKVSNSYIVFDSRDELIGYINDLNNRSLEMKRNEY